jgi:hypothetical protein
LIALIVFVIRIPLLLVSSPPRIFARLRSFGFNEALKKISPTVSENLAGPFSKRNGSLHGQPSQPSLQAARFTGHELQWDER